MDAFLRNMDAYLDKYCQSFLFSGILRVSQNGKLLYQRCMGYADVENRVPITEDSVFTLYSLSKPFCALGLLKLVERGLVNLDAHPGLYVPQAKGFDARVTLRNMLWHASGMPDFHLLEGTNLEHDIGCMLDPRPLIEKLAQLPMLFEPETSTRYSNINFALSALIIENVTGQSYADYMQAEVFKPLGMNTAVVDRPGLLINNRVRGYDVQYDSLVSVTPNPFGMFGAGDIAATVNDVYCLNKAIKNKLLLKPETWQQVLTQSPLSAFGFGCTVNPWYDSLRITHNGGHIGFRTLHVQILEDDFDIILLSNCGYGRTRDSFLMAVLTMYYGEATVMGKRQDMDSGYIRKQEGELPTKLLEPRPARRTLSPLEEQRILGQYENMRIEKDGADYCITLDGWRKLKCYADENGMLANACIDEVYEISTLENGLPVIMGRKKLG